MEDILDIYEMPYDENLPVICMDEKPLSLHGRARDPIPMVPGRARIEDSEYVRNGTCSIFLICEPKAGFRYVSARNHRTAIDWAEEIRDVILEHYCGCKKVILVMDNLNTHSIGSFYKAFDACSARDIARRLEIHYTPKHGSWLNIAECELNALTRQCLDRKMETLEKVQNETKAWCTARNASTVRVDWQFNTDDARTKLRHLYPDFKSARGATL